MPTNSVFKSDTKFSEVSGQEPNTRFDSISAMARKQGDATRNVVNVDELKQWLESALVDRLGDRILSERGQACAKWLRSVGRKWMVRSGEARGYHPEGEERGGAPAWARQALDGGVSLHILSLKESERDELGGILDWMISDEGPALVSDWSRISVEQARSAEKKWVEAMVKSASKQNLEVADALGTRELDSGVLSGPDGRLGWRWVEILSKSALEREGALMRHCVSSYAQSVHEGRKTVFSLRDPDNQPRLTIETQQGSVVQLKAFANQSCPDELRSMIAPFAESFATRCHEKAWELSTHLEAEQAGLVALPGLNAFAVIGEKPSDSIQEALRAKLTHPFASKSLDPGLLLPALCSLGWTEFVALALPRADRMSRERGLWSASSSGQLSMVDLLLTVANPLAGESRALILAVEQGHIEVVKKLLPVSNPQEDGCYVVSVAAKRGDVEMIKIIMAACEPLPSYGEALSMAVRGGKMEAMEFLLPFVEDFAERTSALLEAAERGRTEMIKRLLPLSNPLEMDSFALRLAASRGHLEAVRALLPFSDASAEGGDALACAAREGHLEVVEALLPFCDPKLGKSAAVRGAIESGQERVALRLLPLSDPIQKSAPELRALKFGGQLEMSLRIEAAIDELATLSKSVIPLPDRIHARRSQVAQQDQKPARLDAFRPD